MTSNEAHTKLLYRAFISYSHAADGKLAPALQHALQVLAKPWYKQQNFDIFRDQTDLAASPHLWESITAALDKSEFLILLASPTAAQSKWVRKEVDYWLKHKTIDTIILVLTEGEINWDEQHINFDESKSSAVPSNLFGQFSGEPLWVDLKFAKDEEDLSISNDEFITAIQPIAATLHDQSVADLFGEIKRQHKRTLRIRNAVIFTVFALLIATIIGFLFAKNQQRNAEQKQATAESNLLAVYSMQERQADPTKSYRFAEAAYLKDSSNLTAYGALLYAYHNPNPLYGIFKAMNSTIEAFTLTKDRQHYLMVHGKFGERRYVDLLDLDGNVVKSALVDNEVNSAFLHPSRNSFYTLERYNFKKTFFDVKQWNWDGVLIDSCCKQEHEIQRLCFSNDAKKVLTLASDKSAVVWELATGQKTAVNIPGKITDAVLKDAGKTVLLVSDTNLYRWHLNTQSHELVQTFDRKLSGIIWKSDQQNYVVRAGDGQISIVNQRDSIVNQFEPSLPHAVSSTIDYSPETGNSIVQAGERCYVFKYDVPFNVLKGNDFNIHTIVFSPDGKSILTTGRYDSVVRVWDIKENKPYYLVDSLPIPYTRPDSTDRTTSPNGFSLSQDFQATLYDSAGAEIFDLETSSALNAHFSDDYNYVVIPESGPVEVATLYLINASAVIKEVNALEHPPWQLDSTTLKRYRITIE